MENGAGKDLFVRRRSVSNANPWCFCFPYAGGGPSIYSDWPRILGPQINVSPISLPGRGSRFSEPTYTSFDCLIQDLRRSIVEIAPADFVFFGHSFGAAVAFELAWLLYREHSISPRHLFVSGSGAPHVPVPKTATIQPSSLRELSQEEFATKLRLIGGTPPEVLQNPELLEIVAPIVRADMVLCDDYRAQDAMDQRKLPCPITAFGGTEDTDNVPVSSVTEWSRYTSSEFEMLLIEGGHFFIHSRPEQLIDVIRRKVFS
jgi:medium-chain acyl-[acyl-carrier-protein] hydrolase